MSLQSNHSAHLQFPKANMSSKLRNSRMLKRPPAPIDWAHQSFLNSARDLSHDHSQPQIFIKDREARKVSSDVASAQRQTAIDLNKKEDHTTHQTVTIFLDKLNSKTADHTTSFGSCTTTVPATDSAIDEAGTCSTNSKPASDQQKVQDTSSNITMRDDMTPPLINSDIADEDDDIHTVTTSSTDPNRQNNVFRYYENYRRQQIQLTAPIEPVEESNPSFNRHDNDGSDGKPKESQNVKTKGIKSQKPKSKLKSARTCLKFVFSKMLLTAEKPFQAINERFP